MARKRTSSGFTLIEIIVAAGVATLVIGIAWQFFGAIMGKKDGPSGAVALTAESFLRQDGIDGVQIMTRRIQEAIQIVEPLPGKASSQLVFRDILNDQITIKIQDKKLLSFGPKGEEKEPVAMATSKDPFYPTKPVRVKSCTAALFTAISPSCISMTLTFEGENGATTCLLNTVELQNQDLAR